MNNHACFVGLLGLIHSLSRWKFVPIYRQRAGDAPRTFKICLPPKKSYNKSNLTAMHNGSIQLIYGPMFSGKSSELLRKIRRFEHARKSCLVVNFSHDNRYSTGEEMATHDRVTKKARKLTQLTPLIASLKDYDVVGIDEGQFFEDIVEFCQTAANMGKVVVVAALDGTFERKAFGSIINLIPMAEKVTKLCAVCVYCTKEAAFTKRVVESRQIQLIGGAEMYKPVCRLCFFLEQQPKLEEPEACCQLSSEGLKMNPEFTQELVS